MDKVISLDNVSMTFRMDLNRPTGLKGWVVNLLTKLPHLERMNQARRRIADLYLAGIKNPDIVLPYVIPEATPVWHVFAVRCNQRDKLADHLKEAGIGTNRHYPIPMHLQGAYRDLGIAQGSYSIASASIIRLAR